jgi:hypothetical protein
MHAAARWGWHCNGLHGFPRRGRAWSVRDVARSEEEVGGQTLEAFIGRRRAAGALGGMQNCAAIRA